MARSFARCLGVDGHGPRKRILRFRFALPQRQDQRRDKRHRIRARPGSTLRLQTLPCGNRCNCCDLAVGQQGGSGESDLLGQIARVSRAIPCATIQQETFLWKSILRVRFWDNRTCRRVACAVPALTTGKCNCCHRGGNLCRRHWQPAPDENRAPNAPNGKPYRSNRLWCVYLKSPNGTPESNGKLRSFD